MKLAYKYESNLLNFFVRLLDNFYTVQGLHFAPAFAGQHSAIILRWTQVYLKSSPEPECNQKDVIISGRQDIWNICPISRGLFLRSLDTPCRNCIVAIIAGSWIQGYRCKIQIAQYVRTPVFYPFFPKQACIEKQTVFFPSVEVVTVKLRGEKRLC